MIYINTEKKNCILNITFKRIVKVINKPKILACTRTKIAKRAIIRLSRHLCSVGANAGCAAPRSLVEQL